MAEMIPNHTSAHRGGAVWRQCLTERDEGRFDGLRRFARGCLGTPRALLRPGGFGGPIALLPLIQPAFSTAHLLADDRNGVAVEVACNRELTAVLKIGGGGGTRAALLATFGVMICSRCHGTTSHVWLRRSPPDIPSSSKGIKRAASARSVWASRVAWSASW